MSIACNLVSVHSHLELTCFKLTAELYTLVLCCGHPCYLISGLIMWQGSGPNIITTGLAWYPPRLLKTAH